METIFKGMSEYQKELVYKYGKITVTITKQNEDEYSINIDSGDLDLHNDYSKDVKSFKNLDLRIEFDNSYKKNGYWCVINRYDDFSINSNDYYFKNGNSFDVKHINVILNCVKNTSEFIEQNGGTIKDRMEIKLMTRDEMVDLVDNQKVLPSKVSLMKWQRDLEKIKAEKLTVIDSERSDTCALCYVYGEDCGKCPLYITDNWCNQHGSVWRDVYWYRDGNHEELVDKTEKMIKAINKAIAYEENPKQEVYHADKITITLIPCGFDKFKIKIDGLKCYTETPGEYCDIGYPRAYSYKDGTIYISPSFGISLVDGHEDPDDIIRSYEEAMEIVECLKACSDRLHEMNEAVTETTQIGKMTLTAKKIEDDVYQCSIEGMKTVGECCKPYNNGQDLVCFSFTDKNFTFEHYKGTHVADSVLGRHFEFSLENGKYKQAYPNIDNFKCTKAELKELKELLKECSDRLHKINEPEENVINIGKMTLKYTKLDNDTYQCSITGMKYYNNLPREYCENRDIVSCCLFVDEMRFTISNKYHKDFVFSQYKGCYDTQYAPIDNFKVTKDELDELKTLLQESSDNLHKINEPTPSTPDTKEKLKIKVTQTDNNKVILEITGMKDPNEFDDEEDFSMCARYWKDDNTIELYGEEEGESLELDGCDKEYDWIKIGPDHPMDKETAEKIITIIGASAAKLHVMRHKNENYELEL